MFRFLKGCLVRPSAWRGVPLPRIEPFLRLDRFLASTWRMNRDHTSRQDLIRSQAGVGSTLDLRFENDDPNDRNAVAVHLHGGGQIGYLPSDLAGVVRDWRDQGKTFVISIAELTTDDFDSPFTHVNVRLEVYDHLSAAAEVGDGNGLGAPRPQSGQRVIRALELSVS